MIICKWIASSNGAALQYRDIVHSKKYT